MDKNTLANFPVTPNFTLIDTSVSPPKTYTTEQIDCHADAVANGLLKLNLPANSRIAVIGQNSYNFGTLIIGTSRARHCLVPINFKISQDQIDFCFKDAGVVLAFCDKQYRHMIPSGVPVIEFNTEDYENFLNYSKFEIPEYMPDYAINMMYTSGTTSKPKGVITTYAARLWSINRGSTKLNTEIQIHPAYSTISVSPYYHLAGLNDFDHVIHYSYHVGTTMIIMPMFDARVYLKLVDQYKVNSLRMVAPMMGMLLQEKDLLDKMDFSQVFRIALTSSASPKKMQDDVKSYFKNAFIETPYGLTETGPIFSQTHPYGIPKPATSVGFPVPGIKLRLDEAGVLQVKSPALMQKYNNRPDIQSFTDDGYFITGDIFRVNKYGFYFYVGRSDDMFKSGGEKIYPSEIEEIADQHPAVAMSCVVGVVDDIKGYKPYAFVALKPGHTATELEIQQFIISRVATYQIPRNVWILDMLPRTNIGKIDRRALTDMAISRLQLVQ
jgi:acyl-CoA synthetase (AMP-forming)/AMP-acid ligase II